MSVGFDPGWLALRAPFDAAARSPQALAPLRRWAAGRGGAVLRIADLGGGTGANLRFLAPLLPMPQHWTVIDSDPALLERIDLAALPVPATRLRCDLAAVPDPLAGLAVDLVTASALLDLAGAAWIDRLADLCTARSWPFHAALTYDGTVTLDPADGEDAGIVAAFDRHQRRDKGLGPALGPEAGRHAAAAFRHRGHAVVTAPSPWRLGPDDRGMQHAMLGFLAGAAADMEPDRAPAIAAWRTRRAALVDAGRATMTVGHVDLTALPPA